MALTANSNSVQIISDSPSKTVVKMTFFQAAAGQESDTLKVNVATLAGRTLTLTTKNVAAIGVWFVPGEKVTQNAAVGYVVNSTPSTNAANGSVTLVISAGAFAVGNAASNTAVIGNRGFSADILATVAPTYIAEISSVWFNISPGAVVALQYANSSANVVALTLSGTGYFGKNDLGSRIPNTLASTDGNLYVSTANIAANGAYTMVVELRKGSGFAQRPY